MKPPVLMMSTFERPYDVEVRALILVTAHTRLRQLRKARRQIDLGVWIIGLPADAGRFGSDAAIRQTTDDKGGVGHLRRRETRGVAAFAEVALGVSHTDSRHQRGSSGHDNKQAAPAHVREVSSI